MKVALTVWENRISPLFDSTRMVLIAEVVRHTIREKHFRELDCESSFSRAEKLNELGVDVLICGGITDFFARLIEGHHIEIIPFVVGSVEEVLDAYVSGKSLLEKKFRVPGCNIEKDKNVKCLRHKINSQR